MTKKTKRASEDALDGLHNAIAGELKSILTEGKVVIDKDSGETEHVTADPAYFSAAIRFLKDNGVTAVLKPGGEMQQLIDALNEKDGDVSDEEYQGIMQECVGNG